MNRPISLNLLLTRRCNLNCDYCRLTRVYGGSPYGDIPGEVEPEKWTEVIENLDPIFTNILGGEPLIYDGLYKIIRHMNENDRPYTLITNGILLERYLDSGCDVPSGLCLAYDGRAEDRGRSKKSGVADRFYSSGLHEKYGIEDPTLIATFDESNCSEMRSIVEYFEQFGVYTEVTVRDGSMNIFYDFADAEPLKKSREIDGMLDEAIEMKKDGHLIFNTVDEFNLLKQHYTGTYRCVDPWRNLTLEPDLSPRLCLRIRGLSTPLNSVTDYNQTILSMSFDQVNLCEDCSWNCVMRCDSSVEAGTVEDDILIHGRT